MSDTKRSERAESHILGLLFVLALAALVVAFVAAATGVVSP